MDMKKYNSIAKDANEEKERCGRCRKVFRSDSIIVAVYGMLFCSNKCAFEEFPNLNEDDLETIIASDIGVK